MRACELAALKISDVFDADGKARDTIYLAAAQTKGSDTATVLVNKRLKAQLQRYAAAYPKQIAKPNAPLLFSGKGAGFTAQTVANMFARVVQALARHKHLSTTQRYIEINDSKLRKAVKLI